MLFQEKSAKILIAVAFEILTLWFNIIIKKITAQREGNSHEKTQCKTRNPEH